MLKKRRVAVLIFDGVQLLDFTGPIDVFSAANSFCPNAFEVVTVATSVETVLTWNNLRVIPQYQLEQCPEIDILVLPGGKGVEQMLTNQSLLQWICEQEPRLEHLLSVCNGALFLAQAGLLDGLPATTHFSDYHRIEELAPTAVVKRDVRFVDNGKIVTSAGISAGIDMSLYVVGNLLGSEISAKTAQWLMYPQPE